MERIYLDNAATSWPKPQAVYDAIDRYQREVGAAAGRGGYDSAGFAQREVSRARQGVAGLIGTGDPRRVVFTSNGTEALNLAIFGLLAEGDHVVTTAAEHNSVLRPLAQLRQTRSVEVDYAPCEPAGSVRPETIADLIRPSTRLAAVTSASNVTGALNDIPAIAAICREHGVTLLVDAAQTLGHVPLDVAATGIDLLAAPGHKGLLGPLGSGFLYVAPALENRLTPLLFGGTGTNSSEETQPPGLPERYESGNLNVPALAGLAEGLDWLNCQHADASDDMTQRLLAGLAPVPGLALLGPPAGSPRAPVVSFTLEGYDPQEVAAVLASQGIECRAGLHCAPRVHAALGTDRLGGAIRLSPGFSTTAEHIDFAIEVITQLATTC